MEDDDLKLDCSKTEADKIVFSKKFKVLIWLSIIITFPFIFFIPGYILYGIKEQGWMEYGINNYLCTLLFYSCMGICSITLIIIIKAKKPFSNILVRGMYAQGILFLAGGIIFPYIPGFQRSNLELLALNRDMYIDGTFAIIGMLFLIFGRIMRYGLSYQKEMDTIL